MESLLAFSTAICSSEMRDSLSLSIFIVVFSEIAGMSSTGIVKALAVSIKLVIGWDIWASETIGNKNSPIIMPLLKHFILVIYQLFLSVDLVLLDNYIMRVVFG
jgi:hypothetical protein